MQVEVGACSVDAELKLQLIKTLLNKQIHKYEEPTLMKTLFFNMFLWYCSKDGGHTYTYIK